MEVYAGFQENADWNVGRLLDAVQEMGELRQHAGDLHLRRQWREHGGNGHRLVQRADDAERDRADARAAALADRASTAGSTPGAPTRSRRTTRAPGRGPGTRRSSGASRSPRTWAARATAWWSLGRSGSRDAGALRSQFTHCIDIGPTILEAAGHPRAEGGGRDRAEADGGDELRCTRFDDASAAERHTRAVLRDLRQPGDLQGRLVGGVQARPHPMGLIAADDGEVRARSLRPGAGHVGAVLPARRLHTGQRPRRRAPREARRAQGALLGGGREAQRPAADGGVLGLLRDPAADADKHDADLLRRRREHRLRDDPARLRALVRDRGRALGARAAEPRA